VSTASVRSGLGASIGGERWGGHSAAALVLALVTAMGLAIGPLGVRPANAASATFGSPSATFDYGTSVTFVQPVNLVAVPSRVEILIDYPRALGPNVIELPPPTSSGSQTLTYVLRLADGHILPNTPLTARWRVTTVGAAETGPNVSLLYADTEHAWQTMAGPLVRIHWYDGDAAFGARALSIAEGGVKKAETLLGVTETAPIDFFVYDDQTDFYNALGPGTPENVGGEEHAEIRTMFALITPDEVNASWVSEVLPHELTHLVFDTAVRNPYHFPPRWLNEGLAVYLSRGYDSSDRGLVTSDAAAGTLIPLGGLTGEFPTGDGFFLAYAESVSAIDFLVRKYGQPALVALIRSYATGLTDDEAFSKALGVDTTGFNAAWMTDIGAMTPPTTGPRPAPPGPVPAGWTGGGSNGSNGAAGPTVSAGTSGGPVAVPSAAAVPAAPGSDGGGGSGGALVAAVVLALIVIAGVAVVVRRRSPPGGGGAGGPGGPHEPYGPGGGWVGGPGASGPGGGWVGGPGAGVPGAGGADRPVAPGFDP
jgi:Peptidase MA superfamily